MASRTFLASCAAALLCAVSVLVGAQDTLEDRIARIESHLVPTAADRAGSESLAIADRMRFHRTPGVGVAVVHGGTVEWARGYGILDATSLSRVTLRTRFQAASISKAVTALAAMRLVEIGRLKLDENANVTLRSWKVPESELTRREPVTLRRLLGHTAGLTVHGFPGYAPSGAVPTLVQVLDGVEPANTEPIRVNILPGREWRYSGGGYTVLQQLLIDVTGMPFPSFMRDTVLAPLEMADSTYEQPLPASLRGEAASGHDNAGNPIPGRYHTYPEMAAAGLWTTPADLGKFTVEMQRALAGRSRLLPRATARQMIAGGTSSYGLGLAIAGSGPAGRFGHGGANAGFRCDMVGYVESGDGAVVMTNGNGGGALTSEILRAIAAEYAWRDYPRPRQ